jgi:pyruvate dehydrogenase E2 component (dihydrolipoamide acetyltransferase)
MKKEIKIPDIAENVETGLIAGILVSEGDKVSADQPVVEIETDKATTDIPSPFDGVVGEIKVKEGDEVKVNQVIMIIETEGEGEGEGEQEGSEQEKDNDREKDENKKETNSGTEGENEKADEEEKEEDDEDETTDEKDEGNDDDKKETAKKDDSETKDLSDVPASPSVRRLAREMDVDLTKVEGSGPGNRITVDDVKSFAEKPEKSETSNKSIRLPDFSHWGPATKEQMTTIRKITAKNVSEAWQTIPHVTQFDEADITNLENFRKQHMGKVEKAGGKLTVTAILLKIAGFALQKFPRFNSSLNAENNEIITKHYYNVGIAADTPQGLLVPVVRNVNSKSLQELSVELTELAQKARDKKLSTEEMQGGNFTISNLGGIGGTAFTPIVLPPQVAILGVSRAAYKPIYNDGELEKRLIIPLSLSYDHRVIVGADGARFLRWVCDVIEDPYAILQ